MQKYNYELFISFIILIFILYIKDASLEQRFLDLPSGRTSFIISDKKVIDKRVVIIHGLGSNLHYYFFWARYLESYGYEVLIYDLLCHGDSEWKIEGYITPDKYTDQLAELLHHLNWINKDSNNNQKINLIGISMGGLIALKYSIKYPEQVNKLIMMSPPGLVTSEDSPTLYKLSNSLVSDLAVNIYKYPKLFKFAINVLDKLKIFKIKNSDDTPDEELLKDFSAIIKSGGNTNLFNLHSEFEKLSKLTNKIDMIFFWGINDQTVPLVPAISFLSKKLPQIPIVILPIIGHIPHYDIDIPILLAAEFLNGESNIGILLGQIDSINYLYDNTIQIINGLSFSYYNRDVTINLNRTDELTYFFIDEVNLKFPYCNVNLNYLN